jgi:hypothetical protein
MAQDEAWLKTRHGSRRGMAREDVYLARRHKDADALQILGLVGVQRVRRWQLISCQLPAQLLQRPVVLRPNRRPFVIFVLHFATHSEQTLASRGTISCLALLRAENACGDLGWQQPVQVSQYIEKSKNAPNLILLETTWYWKDRIVSCGCPWYCAPEQTYKHRRPSPPLLAV